MTKDRSVSALFVGAAILVSAFTAVSFASEAGQQASVASSADVSGPYLGQGRPGLFPVRFPPPALQANQTWFWHGSPMFSRDGLEMYFVKMIATQNYRLEINGMKAEGDRWTEPAMPNFASDHFGQNNPFFSVDGDRLYFVSDQPDGHIFMVTREAEGWSSPQPLNIPIPPSLLPGWQFSITRNGTIYLELWGEGHEVPPDLYRTKLVKRQYTTPVFLADLNTEHNAFSPYVNPDERYIIFVSNRPGGYGLHDLYISFRREDKSWSEPRNLGDRINTGSEDGAPGVSADGKCVFFTTQKSGDQGYNPYWADARAWGIVDKKIMGYADYDGDGRTDLAVFDPTTRTWNVKDQFIKRFGRKSAIPVPGDYNGDGSTDIATWDPRKGKWSVLGQLKKKHGRLGDIPVPGDFDGDGRADLAVYRPESGLWDVRKQFKLYFGGPDDIPLVTGK